MKKIFLSNAVLVVAYFLTALAGNILAVPPSYATPIWPPSGIALGLLLVWGFKIIPGIFAGSFLFNLYISIFNEGNSLSEISFTIGFITSTGAVLQALAGWYLVKRYLGLKNPLHLPGDIFKFAMLTGPISCIVSATLSHIGFYATGVISAPNLLISWLTWWVGDSMGVLIFTPVCLIIFAQPALLWRSRVVPVLYPLCLTFIIVLLAHVVFSQAEMKRVQTTFSEMSRYKLNQLANAIQLTTETSRAMSVFFATDQDIRKAQFHRHASKLLDGNSTVEAIHWASIHNSAVLTHLNQTQSSNREELSSEVLQELKKNSLNQNLMYSKIMLKKNSIDKIYIVSAVERAQKLVGYTIVQVDFQHILKSIFGQFNDYTSVTMQKESSSLQPVYTLYKRPERQSGSKWFSASFELLLAGEKWNFSVVSSTAFFNHEYSWDVWSTLTGTLFFCVFMNIVLSILYGQRYLIQYLAEARNTQLQTERAKNLLLLNAAGEGILWIDLNYQVNFINPAAEKMLGYSCDEINGCSILTVLFDEYARSMTHSAESSSVTRAIEDKIIVKINEAQFFRKDQSCFWVEYTCIPIIINEEVKGAAIIFSDISERLENEMKLMQRAHFDLLTGLPNRVSFFEYLEHTLSRAHRNHLQFGVCFLDVDNFKYINDTFGHAYGDKLLSILPGMVKPHLRNSDYFARIGGDEFGLIFEDTHSINDIAGIFKRILSTFNTPLEIDEQLIKTSISIGMAVYPKDGKDSETLLRNADIAMYHSKEMGKSTFSIYTKNANLKINKYNQIESSLLQAIHHKKFQVYYQPILQSVTNKILGVEALLHWEDRILKNIPLVDSITMAEEKGYIFALGELILRRSFKEYSEILTLNPDITLALNISIKQIENPLFIERLKSLLKQYNIHPNQIELELTEASFIKNSYNNVVDVMNSLKNLGIEFTLDNFGKGNSSIHLLKKIPISFIKIDRSFIHQFEKNSDDATTVLASIHLSQGLGINTIAEGVEKLSQLELLRTMGCNIVQGYYFAHPMPLAILLKWIKKHESGFLKI